MDKRTEWEFEYETVLLPSPLPEISEHRDLLLGLVQYAKPEWKYTEGD